MDGLYVEVHYVEVYMQCLSSFKVWLRQNFFDMKDFNCNYSLISIILSLIASIFTFS